KDEPRPPGPPAGAGAWEVQKSGAEDALYAVAAPGNDVAIAVGDNRTILKTADGGKTWKRVAEPKQGWGALDMVLFTSPKEGWATSSTYGALHTTDGGDSW